MTQQTGPEGVTSAERIGLSMREAHAPPVTRDAARRAAKAGRPGAGPRGEVRGTNVAGRRLTGAVQGFGQMWQKTYRLNVGPAVTPRDAIATWKAHFPEFWPEGNRLAGALAGISPADVALSTGVSVLYADEESFTLMTPQAHQFAGWITFSARRSGPDTFAQAHVLMRANDPLYELGLALGGRRKEDLFWAQTLAALGARLGVAEPQVETRSECIDPRRQWRHAGNIWHNAAVRSALRAVAAPFTRLRRRAASGG